MNDASPIDKQETRRTRSRYERIAPVYDLMEWLMEWRMRRWRRRLWSKVEGAEILELGIGTGKNIPCHPEGVKVTAIDISKRMLKRSAKRAQRHDRDLRLVEADAQALPFPDARFDTVIASFLFCSVPDPVLGLREARRVLKPGGRLLLLEHVLTSIPVLRWLMRHLDWLSSRVWGAHIRRETVENVKLAGLDDVQDTNLWLDIVKLIEARRGE